MQLNNMESRLTDATRAGDFHRLRNDHQPFILMMAELYRNCGEHLSVMAELLQSKVSLTEYLGQDKLWLSGLLRFQYADFFETKLFYGDALYLKKSTEVELILKICQFGYTEAKDKTAAKLERLKEWLFNDEELILQEPSLQRISMNHNQKIRNEVCTLIDMNKFDQAFTLLLYWVAYGSPIHDDVQCIWDKMGEERFVKELASAGEPGSAADLLRGWMYKHGRGVTQSDEEAVQWYQKAADSGNAAGMTNLGVMYEEGQGIKQSNEEAVRWYQKAAHAGSPVGMNKLGRMYQDGRGVNQSDEEAVRWYQKAADAGYGAGMTNLGVMYECGRGIKQSHKEAVQLYQKASNAGSAVGMNNLGVMYEAGRGVKQSGEEAVQWFQKAADAGCATGLTNIGRMYQNGQGMRQSDEEAAKWFQKAADAGNVDGMTNIGLMYQNGRGVKQSDEEAAKWFQKAANTKNRVATN